MALPGDEIDVPGEIFLKGDQYGVFRDADLGIAFHEGDPDAHALVVVDELQKAKLIGRLQGVGEHDTLPGGLCLDHMVGVKVGAFGDDLLSGQIPDGDDFPPSQGVALIDGKAEAEPAQEGAVEKIRVLGKTHGEAQVGNLPLHHLLGQKVGDLHDIQGNPLGGKLILKLIQG